MNTAILSAAAESSRRLWLPISDAIVSELSSSVRDENTTRSASSLLRIISREPATFLALIERSTEKRSKTAPSPKALVSRLVTYVQEHASDFISEILRRRIRPISSLTEHEVRPFLYSVASVTSTEILAEAKGVDPLLGSASSLIRQLGFLFIGLQFPSLLKSLLRERADRTGGPEELLSAHFGISPRKLSQEITAKWQLCPATHDALYQTQEPTSQDGTLLRESCTLGEQCAQILAPSLFQADADLTEKAKEEVSVLLGSEGFASLKNEIAQRVEQYERENPEFRKIREQEWQQDNENSWRFFYVRNYSLHDCDESVQQTFLTAYPHFTASAPSPTGLSILTGEVAPRVGFPQGCLFSFENGRRNLVPKLPIGNAKEGFFSECLLTEDTSESKFFRSALDAPYPLLSNNISLWNRVFISITWRLFEQPGEKNQYGGLLHLEVYDDAFQLSRGEMRKRFEAFRTALLQALGLASEHREASRRGV